MPQLKVFTFNPLQVNAYLLYETNGGGILIDPSCSSQSEFAVLKKFMESQGISLKYQLNTHGHFDHLFGAGMVNSEYHPRFLIHEADEPFLRLAEHQARSFGFDFIDDVPVPDGFLSESDLVSTGNIHLKVIHVPGHSLGSVAFYEESGGWLFSGDTLFAGGIGRTDLPGGDYDQILSSIRGKLLNLPGETKVFPGHGPATTIRAEMMNNPFL